MKPKCGECGGKGYTWVGVMDPSPVPCDECHRREEKEREDRKAINIWMDAHPINWKAE